MEPSKEEWQEWLCSPCSKQFLIELESEKQRQLEVTVYGKKEDFESGRGRILEIDYVIDLIKEKGE